jgi:hypothetical protein
MAEDPNQPTESLEAGPSGLDAMMGYLGQAAGSRPTDPPKSNVDAQGIPNDMRPPKSNVDAQGIPDDMRPDPGGNQPQVSPDDELNRQAPWYKNVVTKFMQGFEEQGGWGSGPGALAGAVKDVGEMAGYDLWKFPKEGMAIGPALNKATLEVLYSGARALEGTMNTMWSVVRGGAYAAFGPETGATVAGAVQDPGLDASIGPLGTAAGAIVRESMALGKMRVTGGAADITNLDRAKDAGVLHGPPPANYEITTHEGPPRLLTPKELADIQIKPPTAAFPSNENYTALVPHTPLPADSPYAAHKTVEGLRMTIDGWRTQGQVEEAAKAESWLSKFTEDQAGAGHPGKMWEDIKGLFVSTEAADTPADSVRVHTDHANMLDAETSLWKHMQDTPALRPVLNRIGAQHMGVSYNNTASAADFYRSLAAEVGGPEEASSILARNGIPGLKVPGGHIVFDNRVVEPLNVEGKPVPPPPPKPPQAPPAAAGGGTVADAKGNIRTEVWEGIHDNADVRQLVEKLNEDNGGFRQARAGEMAAEHIEVLAEQTGLPASELSKDGISIKFDNDGKMRAAMQALHDTAMQWHGAAKAAEAAGDTESLIKYQEQQMLHGVVQEYTTGKLAEAGRTLAVPQEFYGPAEQRPLRETQPKVSAVDEQKKKVEEITKKAEDKEKEAADATKKAEEAQKAGRGSKGWSDAARKAAADARAARQAAKEEAEKPVFTGKEGIKEFRQKVKTKEDLEAFLKAKGQTIDGLRAEARAVSKLNPATNQVTKLGTRLQRQKAGQPPLPEERSNWLQRLVVNSLVSGTGTHARYAIMGQVMSYVENGLVPIGGGAFHYLKSFVKDIAPEERMRMGEIGPRLAGLWNGGPNALRAMVASAKTDTYVPLPPQVKLGAGGTPIAGATRGGGLIGLPMRGVMAIHTFHRFEGYYGEAHAQAYRRAMADGGPTTGAAFSQRITDYLQNPTPRAEAAAVEAGDRAALTQSVGGVMGAAGAAIRNHPIGFLFAPFTHIPANVVNVGAEYSPGLNLLNRKARDTLLGKYGDANQAKAVGRLAVGGAIMAAVIPHYMAGKLTGQGPVDPKARAEWLETNRPFSFDAGDGVWRSYSGLGPLSVAAVWAASLAEIGRAAWAGHSAKDPAISDKDYTEAAFLAMHTAGHLAEEAGLRGLMDLVEAMEDPRSHSPRELQNLAGMTVPSGAAQLASSMDPEVRRVNSWLDAIQNRIPGQRQKLQPKLDMLGMPVPNPNYGIVGHVFPNSPRNKDPIFQEMQRLDIMPTRMPQEIEGQQLTPEEQAKYQATFGVTARHLLEARVAAPDWRSKPDFVRTTIIKELLSTSAKMAKASMMVDPDGARKFINGPIQDKVDRVNGTKERPDLYQRP